MAVCNGVTGIALFCFICDVRYTTGSLNWQRHVEGACCGVKVGHGDVTSLRNIFICYLPVIIIRIRVGIGLHQYKFLNVTEGA
jgi:hypothetical protein